MSSGYVLFVIKRRLPPTSLEEKWGEPEILLYVQECDVSNVTIYVSQSITDHANQINTYLLPIYDLGMLYSYCEIFPYIATPCT